MSLSVSTLSTALQALASPGGFPESFAEAGQKWADAYAAYAASAEVPWGFAVGVDGGKAALASGLTAAFASGAAAPAMASAFTLFWLSPPVTFSGARTGLVTVVTGTAILAAALDATFAQNIASRASVADACDAIAADIDAFTTTVTVTSPAPPPPVIGLVS